MKTALILGISGQDGALHLLVSIRFNACVTSLYNAGSSEFCGET